MPDAGLTYNTHIFNPGRPYPGFGMDVNVNRKDPVKSMNTIITIGRQYGSGGKKIGRKLAACFDIPFYDKQLLKIAAKESGLCEEMFENYDEKPTPSFLYTLVMDPYSLGFNPGNIEMPINQKVFLAAFDTIKNLASQGPCVIVGRCADYALRDYDNALNVFIQAPYEFKKERIRREYLIPEDKIKSQSVHMDKQRASYYNYYTSRKWGDARSYHLCIDSSVLGIDGTVELIRQAVLLKEGKA